MANHGGAWPREMEISVSIHPHRLLELLWAREAYGLRTTSSIPSLVSTPDALDPVTDSRARGLVWDELWDENLRCEAEGIPAGFAEELNRAETTQARAALLGTIQSQRWNDLNTDIPIGVPFDEWLRDQKAAALAERDQKFEESPERMATDALIDAWQAGLSRIITLPCRGNYSLPVRGTTLLVTDTTRADPDCYATALRAFAVG